MKIAIILSLSVAVLALAFYMIYAGLSLLSRKIDHKSLTF